jgi:hypothetical protein
MKKLVALLISSALVLTSLFTISKVAIPSYEMQAKQSTGAIFVHGVFECSGSEIGHTNDGGGVFLTARHCVADADTNEIQTGLAV